MVKTPIKSWYRTLIRPLESVYTRYRHKLPAIRYLEYNNIRVDIAQKKFDRFFPKYRNLKDIPNYEAVLVAALEKYVQVANSVTIVGGGYGVTACVAGKKTGTDGRVVCYEGNQEMAERAARAVKLNGVEKQVKIRAAVVARDIGVYEGRKAAYLISPEDLEDCDVLQLDCEGAEIEIISSMIIEPSVVLVETHGYLGAPTDEVAETLRRKGYDVSHLGVAEPRMSALCEELDVRCLVGCRME